MMRNKAIALSLTALEKQTETINKEKGRLLNFIKSKVSNTEDAEDILQDVFLQFINGYGSINSIDKATSWLFSVARNKIIDLYRKRKVREGQVSIEYNSNGEDGPLSLIDILPNVEGTPEDAYFRELVWEAVTDALDDLPMEQRKVFMMHEFEGMSFKAIAAQTGETVNTLLSRKRYAVLAMRSVLEDLYNDI